MSTSSEVLQGNQIHANTIKDFHFFSRQNSNFHTLEINFKAVATSPVKRIFNRRSQQDYRLQVLTILHEFFTGVAGCVSQKGQNNGLNRHQTRVFERAGPPWDTSPGFSTQYIDWLIDWLLFINMPSLLWLLTSAWFTVQGMWFLKWTNIYTAINTFSFLHQAWD